VAYEDAGCTISPTSSDVLSLINFSNELKGLIGSQVNAARISVEKLRPPSKAKARKAALAKLDGRAKRATAMRSHAHLLLSAVSCGVMPFYIRSPENHLITDD
jgi:hypothetical protein